MTTTSSRSKIAPKKPTMVIIVSVFISGLCTGDALSRSRIYRFPEREDFLCTLEVFHPEHSIAKGTIAKGLEELAVCVNH